ncbi:MAG: pyruvate:ferredoxin (flavodoxin) oxidoreductase [Clostridia bacterium]|nr:pyruvate:ferredoxin (flavodoxin) oxidoreductase [Clostridia bacterium]MDE7328260.1 pyruvate:ferredoxin (flavodoxin) oxidoreductase [Clostridia bacterium]
MSKKMTIDGNTAAAHVAYAFSEVAAIYPITPSSPMAENCDEWATAGRKNLFGQVLKLAEMQSEAGAAGAVHGSLMAGALTTTFTASQGLLLMIPNMYKIAGELTPCVFHVSARALAYHALNIFGDHSDVMACRQTGFAMLCSNSVQEVMDLALVSHLATLKAKVPFMHFFDGFRTSHEVSKIEVIDYADMKKLVDKKYTKYIDDFKKRSLNPEHPVQKGTAQNSDIYFQNREACNKYYEAVPAIVEEAMQDVEKLTGRAYKPYQYYGAPDAESIIVIMGSGAEAVSETVDYRNARGGKYGVLKVRLFRPFAASMFADAIPASVKRIAVLDRVKECGSAGEPLYLDVVTALNETGRKDITVTGGRYGLGSKEFTPSMINAIYDNMESAQAKNHFTVGIIDDVTNTSIEVKEKIDASAKGAISCKFYGLGSDGTVGSNKNSIKIIGDYTEKYAQAYFAYDSKKSGGITVSHLRFGDTPIRSSYLIDQADFVACHNPSYVTKYDMISDLKDGGVFLLNSPWSLEELDKQLPAKMKNMIAQKHIKFYNIDAIKVVTEIGLGNRISTTMQACFFKLANVIDYAEADKHMKEFVVKSFSKKGEKIVNMNFAAIDNAIANLQEINYPESWATTTKGAVVKPVTKDKYFTNVIAPILAQEGDKLPVSAFVDHADGSVPTGTTKFEKRGIAVKVPVWIKENCLQCNQCSFVCPHACIIPVAQKPENLANAPKTFKTVDMKNPKAKEYKFRIQVSPLDCSGCGNCANICPAKEKALVMAPLADALANGQAENWTYADSFGNSDVPIARDSVIGSQFNRSLFEFSGACAGCGETPYLKVVTQLYGDRMIVANATGCSSIYGGSAPTCPYSKNKNGEGPAWANSLFEDNAEFGFGMLTATNQRRIKLMEDMEAVMALGVSDDLSAKFTAWMETYNDAIANKPACDAIKAVIADAAKSEKDVEKKALLTSISKNTDCLVKKSVWAFGGDGWAYDIGYGGLDHVLAMGQNINVVVLDTEVYSNTGGQASKSSPTGAVAKFAAGGKITKKKDLGKMAMSYGYVYVAQVAMGANMNQYVKALKEAEAYDGPSLIICYAPCINHGINMSNSQLEEKRAVEAGYWQLYRYNPALAEEGKNPFILDSKEATADYKEFLLGENRYAQLAKSKPQVAEKLFAINEKEAKERYAGYKKLSE